MELTADFIRDRLYSFVRQKQYHGRTVPSSAYQNSLRKIQQQVEFMYKVNTVQAWCRMVVHLEDDLLEVLPGEKTKFWQKRKTIIAIIIKCREVVKKNKSKL